MKDKQSKAPIMHPNPDGQAPPMPGGPGVPIEPGQPGHGGTELPGFKHYYALALQSILSNPNSSLLPAAVDGYVALAVMYARSSLKHMSED